MATSILNIDTPIVSIQEARRFIVECMIAAGSDRKNAEIIGENLILADYRGHYSHGMNRLDMYVKDVVDGVCDPQALPEIIKQTPAVAWVDGKNGLGAVIGKFCMELAIEKAKNVGIGMVVAKETNHYGIAGIYSLQALEEGLLGLSFTNTSPLMAPTRAKGAALGTNPLSLGAPGLDGDCFMLDMATSAVAVGKIEMQMRKNEEMPKEWALDENGQQTTNPVEAFNAKRLMPLGGAEHNSGYKGYGLGMLVEIFCGILGGSNFGPNIRKWGTSNVKANLGQCFIAIDPECFAPGFSGRMSELMDYLRSMEPVDESLPVLVPGDTEKQHIESVDNAGGLRYVENQWETCRKLSEQLNVPLMKNINDI